MTASKEIFADGRNLAPLKFGKDLCNRVYPSENGHKIRKNKNNAETENLEFFICID